MASVALALLVAQIVSVVLLYRAGEDRRETQTLTAAAFQLINGPDRLDREARRDERRGPRQERRSANRGSDTDGGNRFGPGAPSRLPPRIRYTVTQDAPTSIAQSSSSRETRLREVLEREGVVPHQAAVVVLRAGNDATLVDFLEGRPRFERRSEWRERALVIASIQRTEGGPWENARILSPRRPQAALGVLLFQTVLTFGFLIVVLYLVLRRITRPLASLTKRVDTFSKRPERAVLLEESGPSDTRLLIAAHNAMETRIAALLDEKNVMLGAIGHDLKPPVSKTSLPLWMTSFRWHGWGVTALRPKRLIWAHLPSGLRKNLKIWARRSRSLIRRDSLRKSK